MAFVQTSRPEPRNINFVGSKGRYSGNEPGLVIERIMRRPPNKECADCFAPNPNFINITLTTFLCKPCASVHIKLQKTHKHDSIVTVKHLPTTVLTQYEISRMQQANAGNEAVNATYLANYDLKSSSAHPHPNQHSEYELRKSWIIHKYMKRTWVVNQKPKTLPDQASAILSQITQIKNRLLKEQFSSGPVRTRSPHSNSSNGTIIAHNLVSVFPQRLSESSGQFANPARDGAVSNPTPPVNSRRSTIGSTKELISSDSSVVSRRYSYIHGDRRQMSDNASVGHSSVSSRRGNSTNGMMSPSIHRTNSPDRESVNLSFEASSVSSRRPRSSSIDSTETGRSMTSRRSDAENTNSFVSSSILQLTTHEVILELMSQTENKRCADCATRHPKFLNLSLKSFVCSLCAHVHQHEFSHNVVDIETHRFTKNDITRMSGKDVGNAKLNSIYLSRYDPIKEVDSPPNAGSTRSFRMSWMMRKYVVKTWCSERYLQAEEKKLKLRSPLADPHISSTSSYISETNTLSNEPSMPKKNVRWSTSIKKLSTGDQASRNSFRMRSNSPPLDETLQTAIGRSSTMQKSVSPESHGKHNRKMESPHKRPQPRSDPFKDSQIYTAIKMRHNAPQAVISKHIEGTEAPVRNSIVQTSTSNGHNKTHGWRQALPINEPYEDAIFGTSLEDNRAIESSSYFNDYHTGQMHHLRLDDSHPMISNHDTCDNMDDMESMPQDLDAIYADEPRVGRSLFKPIVIPNAYKLSNSFVDKTKNGVRKRVWFSVPKDRSDITYNDIQDPALSNFDVHPKKSYFQEPHLEPQAQQPQPTVRSLLPSELQSLLPSELQVSLQKANKKMTSFIHAKGTQISEVQSSLKHANRNLTQKLKSKRRPSLRRVSSAEDIMNFEEEEKFIEDLYGPVKQDLESVRIDRVRRRNSFF